MEGKVLQNLGHGTRTGSMSLTEVVLVVSGASELWDALLLMFKIECDWKNGGEWTREGGRWTREGGAASSRGAQGVVGVGTGDV